MEFKKIKQIMDDNDLYSAMDLEEYIKTSKTFYNVLFKFEIYSAKILEQVLYEYNELKQELDIPIEETHILGKALELVCKNVTEYYDCDLTLIN